MIIRELESEHCRFPLPEYLTPVSPLKLQTAKFRGQGESKFVPNFFDLTRLEVLDLNGSTGYYEMTAIWETKLSSLRQLKLCFADPQRYLQHIRSHF